MMLFKKLSRITFELDEDLKIAFADTCRRRGTTMTKACKKLIHDYVFIPDAPNEGTGKTKTTNKE